MNFDYKFAKFILVGCSNTLISFSVFHVTLLALPDLALKGGLAQGISYIPAIFWSYYWNSRWTFNQTTARKNTLLSFTLVQVMFLIISSVLVSVGVDYLNFPPTIVWFVVSAFITICNFIISKKILTS